MCICGEYALIVVDSGFFLLMRYWFLRVMPSFLGGSERCLFFFFPNYVFFKSMC